MPLSKQAKALYEEALRRKGLRRNRDDYGSAYLEEIWPE